MKRTQDTGHYRSIGTQENLFSVLSGIFSGSMVSLSDLKRHLGDSEVNNVAGNSMEAVFEGSNIHFFEPHSFDFTEKYFISIDRQKLIKIIEDWEAATKSLPNWVVITEENGEITVEPSMKKPDVLRQQEKS